MKKDIKKFSGLYTHPNPLSQVPEGSLSLALNCSIDREGVVENRRGFNFYGSNVYSIAIDKLLDYKSRVLAHHGAVLSYDSDGAGTMVNYPGAISNPDPSTKVRSQEQNGSLFVTSLEGVKKIEALSATPMQAGIPVALDTKLDFGSGADGYMPYNSRVAYRVAWGRKDVNNVITIGAPSSRAEIANIPVTISTLGRSGSTVTATTEGPHGYSTGDIVHIEGSEAFVNLVSLAQNAEPDDMTVTGVVALAADCPQAGDIVTIRGVGQNEYNGDFTVISNPTSTSFTYAFAATIATSTPASGDIQAGTFTDGYNGAYVITVLSPTSFSYTINTTPVTTASAIDGQTMIAGKNEDISLSFPVPSGINTSFFYRIYRSTVTDSPDVTPDDRMFLVYEAPYVSGSTINVTDITPIDLEGEELYTNATQEGIAQANNPPPFAKDIALYKTFMFYSNTHREQALDLQLTSVDGIVRDTDTITIGSEVYTASSAENIGAKKFRLFADQYSCALTRVGAVATIVTSENHGLTAGDRVFIADATDPGFNGSYSVVTVPSSTSITIKVDTSLAASDSVTLSTGSPAQNIASTAASLSYVITKASSLYYSFYTSGPDDVPGMLRIQARSESTGQFTITGSNSFKPKFNPALPANTDNETVGNRLYYAKNQQPDSVPLTNYFDVGPRDKSILRIIALRDSMFIIKEEGVYRLAGDDDRSFTITLFDSNLRCQAPDSASRLANNIFMFTDQGVVRFGDGGISLVSRPIERSLLPLLTFPNFEKLMHGVGYESDRKYILWAQNEITDVVPTVCFVYNYITDAWTKWDKPAKSAIVISDRMYLANTYTNTILQERKDRVREDKKDESVSAVITNYNIDVATIDYTYATFVLEPGMLVQQGDTKAKILSITGTNVCQLDRTASFVTGACTVSRPIKMQLEMTPETGDSPGTMKQFREMQFYPESDSFTEAQIYFSSDLSNIVRAVDFSYPSRELGWGFFPWNGEPWGNSGSTLGTTPLRTFVPKDIQRCRSLTIGMVHNVANENIALLNTEITYNTNTERTTR